MDLRLFVHSRMRALRRATTPWLPRGKRKLDNRAADDPLRRIRLHARGRKFVRDASSSTEWDSILVCLMALTAMAVGYRLAHVLHFDMAGTLMAPFVLVGLGVVIWGRMPLGARILGLVFALVFLLWPLLV